jgi:TRAP-type C4-dicarboxylate transport system permease small subunit
MMKDLDPIVIPLVRLCEALSVLIGSFVTIALVFSVVSRYAFNYSLGWIEETSSIFMAWMMFLISPVGFHEHIHIGVEFLLEKAPGRIRSGLEALINLGTIALFILVGYYGVSVAQADFSIMMSTLPIARGWFLLVIPFSSAIVVVVCANNLIRLRQSGWGRHREETPDL